MAQGALQRVECVSGCGGGDASTLAVLGLVIAIIGLALALWAIKISNKSLLIATEQHGVFLRELNACAEFELEIYLENHVGQKIATDCDQVELRLKAIITNIGDKAATDVALSISFPVSLVDPHWIVPPDWEIPTVQNSGPLPATQEIWDSKGNRTPANYLLKVIDRVNLKSPRVSFASVSITTPTKPGESRKVPIHLSAWSDELPDDRGIAWIGFEVEVERVP
jgi:hypothetical protein